MDSATTIDGTAGLPEPLREVVDEFAEAPREIVLELLLEYADAVPELPPELADHPELMESVPECQTPFFLRAEIDDQDRVSVWFKSPPEAPTTRAFAGILATGLADATADEILAVPDDFYLAMGLGAVISPLRLRGMAAILGRLKRQIRENRRDRPGAADRRDADRGDADRRDADRRDAHGRAPAGR